MKSVRRTVLAVVGLATSAGAVPAPAPPEAAPAPATAAAEGTRSPALFWNARERTAAALGRLDAGDPTGAAESLDTAWQLRPEDPLAAYNAGSGRLLAGRPDALPALEAAARTLAANQSSDERATELAADAFYNLGNARLAGGDAGGALEAYAETLRRAPRREDAKRNLELALRALEQQQQQQNPGAPGREGDTRNDEAGGQDSQTGDGEPKPDEKTSREGEDEDRTGGESREGNDSVSQPGAEKGAPNGTGDSSSPTDAPPTPPSTEGLSPSSESSPSTEESSNSPDTPPSSQPAAPAGSRRRERLPGFVDQPELTADQAAALLDAVEDLERQQRRQRALERARRRSEVEKDW